MVVVVVVVTVVVDVVFVVVIVVDFVQVPFKVYLRLLEMEVEFWWVWWDGGLWWAVLVCRPIFMSNPTRVRKTIKPSSEPFTANSNLPHNSGNFRTK